MPRVVVSGIGILTSNGWDLESFSRSLRDGVSGISEITLFDTRQHRTKVAGEVKREHIINSISEQSDRALAFAKYSVDQALKDAMVDEGLVKKRRVAVCLGTIAAGWATFENTFSQIISGQSIQDEDVDFSSINLTDFICAEYDFSGFKYTAVTACASANNAIGLGFDLIRYGLADMAITGGVDVLTELGLAGFNVLRVLTMDRCRPFDLNRSGFAIGEGGGILILETDDSCRERGAQPHAEILGYGSSCDAYHATGPDPSGQGATHAIKEALRVGCITAKEVDYINAHGTATPQNDAMETKAIKNALGAYAYEVPISSIKPLVGHTMGAAGAIEAIASIAMMKDGFLASTHNYQTPDPDCDLNYITGGVARNSDVDVTLSNAFGFGGSNCCLLIRRGA